jgi:hypothetical protein
MIPRIIIIPALVVATGCFNWGTRPNDYRPATGPNGASVRARVRAEPDRVGELLAADAGGITIRSSRVVRIAWTRIERLDVEGLGKVCDVRFNELAGPEQIEHLRLLSRFPQGLERLPITIDSLIADASRESQRFGDRRVAIAEGYRRVGVDFPSMGEHWIDLAGLLRNRIDPAHPTLLTYATIAGQPTLLGLGFVIVTHGDSSPTNVPGWPADWHEHSGFLSDESGASIGPVRHDSPTHVWVMHVWTALENPDGRLEADNWSLPFVRAGVAVPHTLDADAGRAASLATGGDEYLRDVLTDAGLRTPSNSATVDSAIAAARLRAIAVLRPVPDVAALHDAWSALATALETALGPNVRQIIRPTHAHVHAAER